MIALPCEVQPLAGETPHGFLGRLAAANTIDVDALVRFIARSLGLTMVRKPDGAVIAAIEQLGNLPAGHFARERSSFRVPRRCHHHQWLLQRCATCDVIDRPRRACVVCSGGVRTEITSRGGPFCVRHNRWHFDDQDEQVRPAWTCARAEKCLSGELWTRGVTMHTGELELAKELVLGSLPDTPTQPTWIPALYLPAVKLTLILTDPVVASALVTHREDVTRQVEALIGLTVGVSRGVPTLALEEAARYMIEAHRAALLEATRMPNSPTATLRRVRFEKGIAEAAHRRHTVLLRHVSDVRVCAFGEGGPVAAAPRSRTVSNRTLGRAPQRQVPGGAGS